MNWFRNVVDEREDLEAKRIESGAYYVFLFGLGIAIIVQSFIFGISFENVVGELIILLIGVGWAMVGYFRKGIWDYRTKPGIKVYVGTGFVTALVYVIISTLARYFRSEADLLTSLKYAAIGSITIFFVVFIILALVGTITMQRRKKLEQKFEDAD